MYVRVWCGGVWCVVCDVCQLCWKIRLGEKENEFLLKGALILKRISSSRSLLLLFFSSLAPTPIFVLYHFLLLLTPHQSNVFHMSFVCFPLRILTLPCNVPHILHTCLTRSSHILHSTGSKVSRLLCTRPLPVPHTSHPSHVPHTFFTTLSHILHTFLAHSSHALQSTGSQSQQAIHTSLAGPSHILLTSLHVPHTFFTCLTSFTRPSHVPRTSLACPSHVLRSTGSHSQQAIMQNYLDHLMDKSITLEVSLT